MDKKEIRNKITSLHHSCKKSIIIFQKCANQHSLDFDDLKQLCSFYEQLVGYDISTEESQSYAKFKTNSSNIVDLCNFLEKVVWFYTNNLHIFQKINIYDVDPPSEKHVKDKIEKKMHEIQNIYECIKQYEGHLDFPVGFSVERIKNDAAQLDVWKVEHRSRQEELHQLYAKQEKLRKENNKYYIEDIFKKIVTHCSNILVQLTKKEENITAFHVNSFKKEDLDYFYDILIDNTNKDQIIKEIHRKQFYRIMKCKPCKEKIKIINKKATLFCVAIDFFSQLVDEKERSKWVNTIICNSVDGIDTNYYWKKYRSYKKLNNTMTNPYQIVPKSVGKLIYKLVGMGFKEPKK